MGRVVLGVDPHKRSATIEVVDERERMLHSGTVRTTTATGRCWLSVGGSRAGCGRWRAAAVSAGTWPNGWSPTGEAVVDVPAKLAARARVFDTGNGRKTDAADAHSVAVVALRTKDLTPVRVDDELAVLRLLVRPPR